jgi:hypothetical protein
MTDVNQGTFEFYVSDDFLTNALVFVTVTPPLPLQITAIVNDVTTLGGNDGAVDLTVMGQQPVTFNWSVPGNPSITFANPTAEDQSGLVSGIYSVTITEISGCETIKRFIINQPTSDAGGPSNPSYSPNTTNYQPGTVN